MCFPFLVKAFSGSVLVFGGKGNLANIVPPVFLVGFAPQGEKSAANSFFSQVFFWGHRML